MKKVNFMVVVMFCIFMIDGIGSYANSEIHTVRFYTAVGDGSAFTGNNHSGVTWSIAHDPASADFVEVNGVAAKAQSGEYSWGDRTFVLGRMFLPFDTSGIPDDATIISAVFYGYVSSKDSPDNDGDDYIAIVKAFQDSTNTLSVEDYEDCGYDIGNETGGRARYTPIVEGSNRLDISSDIIVGQYNVWDLNAEGLNWINKIGYTKLGMREGHDLLNHLYDGEANKKNYVYIYMSEEVGTDKDPYLEVTYQAVPPNQLPVAVVGDNQSVSVGDIVTLDGSGSYDPDETYPLTYSWQIISKPLGSTAELNDPSLPNPSFMVDVLGDYIVQLIVTDNLGASSEPTITQEFVIQPEPEDGLDVWVSSVYYGGGLDNHYLIAGGWGDWYYSFIGFDIDSLPQDVNNAKIYLHSWPDLSEGDPTPPSLSSIYLDRVTSPWDETTIWANRPTYVNITTLPQPVYDSWYTIDITSLYNNWKNGTYPNYGIQIRPTTNCCNINNVFHSSDYMDDPSLRPKLVISGLLHPQTLISAVNTPPVADAGEDQAVIQIGTIVQVDGCQSWDNEGDSLSYDWSIISKPTGSTALLLDPTSCNPTFTADIHGDYSFQLIVNDPWAPSNPDTVIVSFDNIIPIAMAKADPPSVVQGETVYIDGNDSQDANLDYLTYLWNFVSKPPDSLASIAEPTFVQTSFVADVPGEYIVSLVVNDGYADSIPYNLNVIAITYQTAITQKLLDTAEVVNELNPDVFKNDNMQKTFIKKINATLRLVDLGDYTDALNKLENDIFAKTNGCAETGYPDKNDWLKDCESQGQVYPLVIETITLLKNLI